MDRCVTDLIYGIRGALVPKKNEKSQKSGGRSSLVVGKNIAGVGGQGLFFFAAHEVDIELGDADRAEAVELLAMLLDGADETEAIDDFIGNEIGVIAADFAMMVVIVFAFVFDEGSE